MTPSEAWADIERVEVDPSAVAAFDRGTQFSAIAFDLARETASWACVAACTSPSERGWSRSEAVLAGHSVRLFKLLRAFLEQVSQERADLAWVVLRMTSECAINLLYLLNDHTGELSDSYVRYSLQHEWRLLADIEANVQARGGAELPIERRMMRSISRMFMQSAVDPASRPPRWLRHWGGGDLKHKAAAVGLERAYLSVFGGPSGSVHGNWGDLLQHHLIAEDDGSFKPNLEVATMKQPQPFLAVSTIAVRAVAQYLAHVDSREFAPALQQLDDLLARVDAVDGLHEEFLKRRSNTPLQPTSDDGDPG